MARSKVLLLGATGQTGRSVLDGLLEYDQDVSHRAPSPDTSETLTEHLLVGCHCPYSTKFYRETLCS